MKVLVFKQGDWWVGQGLEYDIASQAKTYEGIVEEMKRQVTAHFAISRELMRQPFQGLSSAPEVFWKLAIWGNK